MTNPTALKFISNASGSYSGSGASRTFGNHVGEYVYNVKSYGALGNDDGSGSGTDDTMAIQACLDAAITDTTFQYWSYSNLTRHVYFPPGIYKTTAPLLIPAFTHGSMIYGAGMGVSVINNVTSTSEVIHANGFLNSTMRDMSLWSIGGANSECYHWDEDVYTASSKTKENCWINVEFRGAENGLVAGLTGQCDNVLVLNCRFRDHAHNGIFLRGGNALMWIVQGGSFEGCGSAGIRVSAGNIPTIHGVYFDNNTANDIVSDYSFAMTIIGCYSTSSTSNANISALGATKIIGCTSLGTGSFLAIGFNGITVAGTAPVCMEGCVVPSGTVREFGGASPHSTVYLRACDHSGTMFSAYTGAVKEDI